MSRPIRRARSTDCTISYWQAVKKFRIGIPRPNIDRVVAKNRFRPRRMYLFVATLAGLSREEFGHSRVENRRHAGDPHFMHEALFGKLPGGSRRHHFSEANGPRLCRRI